MKIIIYSDLHLEFGIDFKPPKDSDADVMILAWDIITFCNYQPLGKFLARWDKPGIFVAGNHEFYTNMHEEATKFQEWFAKAHPNVNFLQDSSITIDEIHFFGGTMWADFLDGSENAMRTAMAPRKYIRDHSNAA